MTDHPINSAFQDGVPVSKATVRSYESTYNRIRVPNVAYVRARTLTDAWGFDLGVAGGQFDLDPTDTTSADNSCSVIVDVAGNRFKRSVRQRLLADATYYVRPDGNDNNSGLVNNAGGAFLTPNGAYTALASMLDFNGKTVSMQLADGTYGAGLQITSPWTGGGALTIKGNNATPANVHISTASAIVGGFRNDVVLPGPVTIQDLKITPSAYAAIAMFGAGQVYFNNLVFGAALTYHLWSNHAGAEIEASGNYSIIGGAQYHAIAVYASTIRANARTLTLSGTPAFTAFVNAIRGGIIVMQSDTFSGAATGSRYTATENGVINVASGGVNYFPGNAAGTTGTGGQYN